MYDEEFYVIAVLIGFFIQAVIMGIITRKINESKGYYGGFAWGFWLGIIGIIVVACRSDNHHASYRESAQDAAMREFAREENDKRLLKEGGWKCYRCGRVNASYDSTCNCGMYVQQNRDWKKKQEEKKRMIAEEQKANEAKRQANDIARFKQLLDSGAITQEEYDAKKKQILKL